jgi:hypothetical protein
MGGRRAIADLSRVEGRVAVMATITMMERAGGTSGDTTELGERFGEPLPRRELAPDWSPGGSALEPLLYDEDDEDDEADLDDEDVFADDDDLGGTEDFEDEEDDDLVEGDADELGEDADSSEDEDDEDF